MSRDKIEQIKNEILGEVWAYFPSHTISQIKDKTFELCKNRFGDVDDAFLNTFFEYINSSINLYYANLDLNDTLNEFQLLLQKN